jgi:type II secretory pathway component PulF
VPALGPYLQALALGRFAMTLRLTMETGMDIRRAVGLSLEATSNNAFLVVADPVALRLQEGDSLTRALQPTGLFPEEFLHILEVAEESGSVPEVMNRQAQNYHEEAGRRLSMLLRGLAGLVWLLYAGFMVAAIFALANIYLSQLPR